MVDKLDQVAAHCQLMVKLSSLHFKANWVGGLIINLLGLLSEGNIVGTLGVKGGGQQHQRHLYPQLFAINIEVVLSMDGSPAQDYVSNDHLCPASGQHSWRSPGDLHTETVEQVFLSVLLDKKLLVHLTADFPLSPTLPPSRISDSLWCIGHES